MTPHTEDNAHFISKGSVETQFRQVVSDKGAAFCLLLDPDRNSANELSQAAEVGQNGGVDFIFIGSSLMLGGNFDDAVKEVKKSVDLPVVVFPGNPGQISDMADAILFLSLISGRNAEYIIGQQVVAAPRIHELELEAIPTGYMLIESGGITSAQYMSMTAPIPRNKPDIAVAHALAARFMGMRLIYLEGGSGGELAVPEIIISEVASTAQLPVIVGGGIRIAEDARSRVVAGAAAIVIGNSLEGSWEVEMIREFAEAIHLD